MIKNLFFAICTLSQAHAQENISFLTVNNFSSSPAKLMIRLENADSMPSLKITAMDNIISLEAHTSLTLEKNNLKPECQKLEMHPPSLELTFILPINDLRLPCILDKIPVGSKIKLEDGKISAQYLLTLIPTGEKYKLSFNSTDTQKFWAVKKKPANVRGSSNSSTQSSIF
jgi:hypothetical protein